MEDKLKQRLTGAAILITIAVLVVPELFRGQSAGETTKPGSQMPSSLPQRSVTIQLEQPGATRSADQLQTPASPVAATVQQQDVASAAAEPAEAAKGQESQAAAAPANATAASASGPAAAAGGSGAAAAATVAPPALTLAPPAAGKSGWSVQLGVFSQRANAERLTRQAQAKNLGVEISGPDRRGLWRVRSGLQDNRDAAQRWLQRAQAAGFSGALTQAP